MTILKDWFSLKDCDKKEKIKCITMYIMIAILVAVDIFMCFTIAKYTASSTPAGDSARVAKFDVSITDVDGGELADKDIVMNLGESLDAQTYDFKVTNNSEVAVSYSLVLTIQDENPYDSSLITITAEDENGNVVNHNTPEKFVNMTTRKYNHRYVFPNVANVGMGSSATGKLVIGLTTQKDSGMSLSISGMTLEIVANQVD